MKAVNIIWDTDGKKIELPNEIEIPFGMTDEDYYWFVYKG